MNIIMPKENVLSLDAIFLNMHVHPVVQNTYLQGNTQDFFTKNMQNCASFILVRLGRKLIGIGSSCGSASG